MFEEILFGNIDKELLTYLIPLGYLTFVLYFYGSKKWNDEFSDFDKISFSMVMSFIVFYFLVRPLSWTCIIIYNFFISNNESIVISPSHTQFISTYIVFSFAIFIISLIIRRISSGSLSENKKVYIGIFKTVSFFLLFFMILFCFFWISLYVGGYFEYIKYFNSYIFSSCVFLTTFLIILITVDKNDVIPLSSINNYFDRNDVKRYAIMAVIVLLIFSAITGLFLFKPSIVETNEQITEMNIELLPVSDMPKHKKIVVTEQIEKKYTISTPILIPWVKVKTNLTLESAEGEIDGNKGQYYINDNYFIIDNSSKQVNVTVVGATEDFYLTDELIYDINYPRFQNETEIVNLTLTNNMPVKINIKDMEIRFNENYILTEDNFVKAQHFANGNGGIRGYEQHGSTIYLQNVRLLENASGTISLILTKQ